jgi:hypothetical protein
VLDEHVGKCVLKLHQRDLGRFRKDTLNSQVFGVVEIRRLGVLERSIPERKTRAANVEILEEALVTCRFGPQTKLRDRSKAGGVNRGKLIGAMRAWIYQ